MYNGRAKALQALDQARKATEQCLAHGYWMPALVITYAFVDAMAWLNRKPENADVTRGDFIDWCNKYILATPSPAVSALDLYAARCGIVHSHVAESKLMREGDARPLWYRLPSGEELIPVQTSSALMASVVDVVPFVRLVYRGAEAFIADVDGDPVKQQVVWERADAYYDLTISHSSNELM